MNVNMLALSVALAIGVTGSLEAQIPLTADPGSSVRTRDELEGLLEAYDELLRSPAYSASVKDAVSRRAALVRTRLTEGDFRVGDRIVLEVEGEPTLPDTVVVQAGPMITLPLFGDISLRGVLRSEIEARLEDALGAFIREPSVQAHGLMRVSIQGAVGQPGFYVVPADMLLSEALMFAGGPGLTAQLDNLRIERGSEVLLQGADLQTAVQDGLTLDQLNMRAGDQIVVPAQGGGFLSTIGIVAGMVGSLSFLIFQLIN